MIGIVAVSHSLPLATAARELALQMGGDAPPRVELAAGTPEGGLGTDAAAIADAIERADSGDGVLVLMDLGSAVLSAETALEFLEPGISARLSPAPFVEGLVAAVVGATSGAAVDVVAAQLETALQAKREQLGLAGSAPDAAAAAPVAQDEQSFEALVRNPSGLHARPAAMFARAAGRFDARVTVADTSRDTAPVPGDSLLALMSLGVKPGTTVRVSASGPEARAALDELRELVEQGFGELWLSAQPSLPAGDAPATPPPRVR